MFEINSEINNWPCENSCRMCKKIYLMYDDWDSFYCSSKCRQDYDYKTYPLTCVICEKEFFFGSLGLKQVCSVECRTKRRKIVEERRIIIKKKCPICPNEFSSTYRNNQKYCSRSCAFFSKSKEYLLLKDSLTLIEEKKHSLVNTTSITDTIKKLEKKSIKKKKYSIATRCNDIIQYIKVSTEDTIRSYKSKKEIYAWYGMKDRCDNPNNISYPDYGGRGIKYCEEFKNKTFFLRYMGKAPSPEHSLDRIDNNKGYEIGNVRWATKLEQLVNRRRQISQYDFSVQQQKVNMLKQILSEVQGSLYDEKS